MNIKAESLPKKDKKSLFASLRQSSLPTQPKNNNRGRISLQLHRRVYFILAMLDLRSEAISSLEKGESTPPNIYYRLRGENVFLMQIASARMFSKAPGKFCLIRYIYEFRTPIVFNGIRFMAFELMALLMIFENRKIYQD